ncbi:MAG: ATP-binding cassette domain-containing protein [Ruminococcaceae bacterium]|nr:ATP-binding cassette domain-containing protein [Oscillospiraceae bacterium]
MIEIKNLTKSYGSKKAVDNISFEVERGEILGFLGPNGAGKTTTMNIITGYLSSTDGTVTVDGFDVVEHPAECKRRIGYLPEQPPLYMDMTVEEYLNFVYDIKGVKEPRKKHIDDILGMVRITEVRGRLIKNLSKGYKQRVGIAQALIGNPEILILDEPTVGLDPKQIIEIRNVIKELGRARTVILSSHILPEVSAICERVIIINKGKIMAIDTPENLSRALSGDNKFMIRVEGKHYDIEQTLKSIDGIESMQELAQKEEGAYDFMIESAPDTDIRKEVTKALAMADLSVLMIKSMDLSLEDVFIQLTEDNAAPAQQEELPAEEIAAEEEAVEETEETEMVEQMEEAEEGADNESNL